MLGREDEFEAASRLISEPGPGFLGDVCGMIVEDQLDRRMGRIGGIDELKEFDEFAAAMAVLDQGVNLAGEQIDTGQQTDCAIALVLVIAREGRMFAGLRRQVRSGRSERLNARLLVVGDEPEFLGLAAGEIHNPSLGLGRDRGLLAGPGSITERRNWTISERPL